MGNIKKSERASAEEQFRLRVLARAACLLLRREWNIGQAELAVLCNTHQQCISLIEHGRPRAPVRVCRMLIEAAGIIRTAPMAMPPAAQAPADAGATA